MENKYLKALETIGGKTLRVYGNEYGRNVKDECKREYELLMEIITEPFNKDLEILELQKTIQMLNNLEDTKNKAYTDSIKNIVSENITLKMRVVELEEKLMKGYMESCETKEQ